MLLFSLLPSLLPTALLALSALPLPIQSASILCAENLYGKPRLADAMTIGNNLPYVKVDPYDQMDAARLFAEPAFFTPKFQGLRNTWRSAIEQLPRVWRFRSARIALLFYADAAGQVATPSVNSNWRLIQAAAAGVLQYCVRGQRGVGGVWIISGTVLSPFSPNLPIHSITRVVNTPPDHVHPFSRKPIDFPHYHVEERRGMHVADAQLPVSPWADHTQTPYLSLYLYESGSPFEDVLNRYMITGLGVNPFNPRGFGVEGVALNSSGVLGAVEDQAVLAGDVAATAGIGAAPGPAPSVVAVLRGELGVQ